jgi:hypothetical protein
MMPPVRGFATVGSGDLTLLALALAAAALFFVSIPELWPLAGADLTQPPSVVVERAREALAATGRDLGGYDAASRLAVDDSALDYVEETFGREWAQSAIGEGLPLVTYSALFRRPGDPDSVLVSLHPSGRLLGWSRTVQEDATGETIEVDAARDRARAALAQGLGLDLASWRETGTTSRDYPNRVDRTFVFERDLSTDPELRERATATVAGGEVVTVWRTMVVPGAANRTARSREAAPYALQAVGFILLSVAVVGAFAVFLVRLRDGSVRLGPAALWASVVFLCAFGTTLLGGYSVFASWDPLWPQWISTLQYLVVASQNQVWTLLVLIAVIAAGDELDRRAGAGRGETLWMIGRGQIAHPRVAVSVVRGFLVGLICGGVMAAAVLALELVAGARTAIQPRGFFFYALNSTAPAVSTLLFFTNVALLEELGYRFFSGTWLMRVTGRTWLAILLPAIVYGLTHTTLDFLPVAEPFWGRALVMTLVGCVWGWAFFRYDALTVVVSHLMSDLFIFTWPRLASGEPSLVVVALLTAGAPLLLAVPGTVAAVRRRAEIRE